MATIAIAVAGAHAQSAGTLQGPAQAGSARGELTITLTVVSSVGLVTGPDGVQRLVLANAPEADNVSAMKVLPSASPVAAPMLLALPRKARQTTRS